MRSSPRPPRLAALARLRQSRKASLLLFAGAMGALLFAAIWFTRERGNLAEAYALVGNRQQTLTATHQRRQEALLRVRLASGAAELVRRARAGGFVEGDWGERLINIRQTPLTREQVNDLLAGVTRSPARIFGAEAFEVSVTRADEGLFDIPDPRSPPLMVTLRGTLLFRTRQPGAFPAPAPASPEDTP